MSKIKITKNKSSNIGFVEEENETYFYLPYSYTDEQDKKEDIIDAKHIYYLINKYYLLLKDNFYGSINDRSLFYAYDFLIKNYLTNGLYYENENLLSKNGNGKINWKKTIKNNSLSIISNNVVYNDFITQKNKIYFENDITKIYMYCLNMSINELGWFYKLNPFKNKTNLSISYMINIVKNEMNKTFNEYKRELFSNLLVILKNEAISGNRNRRNVTTKEFEYVFEFLINWLFGTEKTANFNPKAHYVIDKKEIKTNVIRPDTILTFKNDNSYYCIVIDAKYYPYNYLNNPSVNNLPAQSSINKQFIYQKYIEQNIKTEDGKSYDKVYSIFILPFLAKDNEEKLQKMDVYANAEWNNDAGIIDLYKIDLKTLVEAYYNNDYLLKEKLIELIRSIKNTDI